MIGHRQISEKEFCERGLDTVYQKQCMSQTSKLFFDGINSVAD